MSTSLSPFDRRLLGFTADLLTVRDFGAVQDVLLPGLAHVLSSDVAIFHRVSRSSFKAVTLGWPPEAYRPEHLTAYPGLMRQHPIVAHALSAPAAPREPVRISDWLSRGQWLAHPVYRDCYRNLQIEDQMAATSVDYPTWFCGVSVGRLGRSYRDEERDLMKLVNYHVAAALRRAEAASGQVAALQVAPFLEAAPLSGRVVPTVTDDRLTRRESEIMSFVATGLTDQQIARQLHVSRRTVNKHLEHIYVKLNVTNRLAAVRAIQRQ